MKCLVLFFPIFVLGIIIESSNSLLVDDSREDVIKKVENAWSLLQNMNRVGRTNEGILRELSKYLKPIPASIHKLERELLVNEYEEALQALGKLAKKFPDIVSLHWKSKWSEISVLTSPVDVLYGHFKLFPDMPETFVPGSGILEFDSNTVADLILNPLYSTDDKGLITLSFLLDHAHTTIVSGYEKDAFVELNDELRKSLHENAFCLLNGKTHERMIFGLYLSLVTLDIKEYTILNFAYMLRFALNGTDKGNDVSFATQNLRSKTFEKAEAAKSALNSASARYWQCDPKVHIEGETFEQFKELLQGYIENEKDMHPKGSCKQACSDYTFTKSSCTSDNCRAERKCSGDLVECKFVQADATVCNADAPRRFEWIDYKKGPLLGKKTTCTDRSERRDSHWRFLYHCSNCLCLCDDPESLTTVRHISLAEVTSDLRANKIVTGVRFVMHNKVLHLQIEEGVAGRKGYIVENSSDWKPVTMLSRHDTKKVAQLDYLHRSINLDDFVLGKNYVLTGVKFYWIGEHIGLMVQATQINPITARLLPHTAHWISNENSPDNHQKPRGELKLEDVDVPTYSTKASIPDSVTDQFLKFGPTSRSKDVAQTTIPFIDIQTVRPIPRVWLKGLGLYHKGQEGYGGYIAPRILTHSVSEFLLTEEN